jgi:hypothetical protein
MQIIKVVHASIPNEIDVARQTASAYTYDIEAFLEKNRDRIAQEMRSQPFLPQIDWRNAKSLVQDVAAIGTVYQRYHDALIRVTVEQFVRDLRDQLERLEVISLAMAKARYSHSASIATGVYTLHPFDPLRLVSLARYHRNLAVEKDHELIFLLGSMGAKTLRVAERDDRGNMRAAQLEIASIKAWKGGIKLGHTERKAKELYVRFEGNRVDIDPELLNNSVWFAGDAMLTTLFNDRRSSLNPIRKYTYTNTYTETYDFDFDLAARFLVVKGDLQAEYHSLSRKARFFRVEFD